MTESEYPAALPAPEAVGDIVPGHPPVPITTWYVPAAPDGATMSIPLAQRLVGNYSRSGALVLDLTRGPQVAGVSRATGRRHRHQRGDQLPSGRRSAALIVLEWPLGPVPAVEVMAQCAARLTVGGCVTTVLTAVDDITVNQSLILAARSSGLVYLQHVVAAHDLSQRAASLGPQGVHLRVHTDILVFSKSMFPLERDRG